MRNTARIIVVLCIAPLLLGMRYRDPRTLSFVGTPVTVYVTKDERTEVVFPETLVGTLPPTQQQTEAGSSPTGGIDWSRGPANDRIFLMPRIARYNGTMTLHGASGRSYILYIQSSAQPDISVVIQDGAVGASKQDDEESKHPTRGRLIEFLMRGETPPGYSAEVYKGPVERRIVYRQGPLIIYLVASYTSPRYTGLVLIAENTGPAPIFFPINSLDYKSRELKRAFGDVAEVEMDNMRLGPAPRYRSDSAVATNQSFLYIVSHKQDPHG